MTPDGPVRLVGRRLKDSKEGTAAETFPVVEAAPKGTGYNRHYFWILELEACPTVRHVHDLCIGQKEDSNTNRRTMQSERRRNRQYSNERVKSLNSHKL
jgi:hypothetical protein